MRYPRVVVAGLASGVGKTTVATGLMAALRRRGLTVQAFKIGPDFIDPKYHTAATGRPGRNLDTWIMNRRQVKTLFSKAAAGCDVSVIEGVMGFLDGANSLGRTSTYDVAKLLKTPVVLVVDVNAMMETAAALVKGASELSGEVKIAAVILNRVAGPGHEKACRRAVEKHAKIPVIGAIPNSQEMNLPERHLGLVPIEEDKKLKIRIDEIAEKIEEYVDLDAVVEIAESTQGIRHVGSSRKPQHREKIKVAVAYDAAFNFYYPESLETLRENGAAVTFFSPLQDPKPPEDADMLYIGGGFPELYADQLAGNIAMLKALKKTAEDELPIYAECGGLMYLTRSITTFNNTKHPMVGLLEADTIMTQHPTLSYTKGHAAKSNLLMPAGQGFKGHEFHYSKLENLPRDANLTYTLKIGRGIENQRDGWQQHRTLAAYTHLNLATYKKLVKTLLKIVKIKPITDREK